MSLAPEITLPSDGVAPDVTTGSVSFIGNATVLIRYAGFADNAQGRPQDLR
jgi:hypothetical protein